MIISLRGTSGSGKSTLVRKITALYDGDGEPKFVEGRRRAYYTTHWRASGVAGRRLVVPGHYDIDNGGVDTLKSIDEAYCIAQMMDSDGADVLMEGKCMSDGQKWALDLHREGRDIRIVHLGTPLRTCVSGVRNRGHWIAEHSIQRTYEKVARDVTVFREARIPHVVQGSRAECFNMVREWLQA